MSMSRPMYETAADLSNEAVAAAGVEGAFKCKLVKLPISYRLDFACVRRGVVVAFCEIKARAYSFPQINGMGGYMLSLGKWVAAQALHAATGRPFVLAVLASDGLYALTLTEFSHNGVRIGGRIDRGDSQDVEPCVLLSCDRFKRIA